MDVVFLGARGSGEPSAGHGGMGSPVWDAYQHYASKLDARTRVGYLGVQYPARAVSLNMPAFLAGLGAGIESTMSFLVSRRSCVDEHYVLGGYSQGAMVMYRTMWRIHRRDVPKNQAERLARNIDGYLLIASGDRLGADERIVNYGTAPGNKNSWGVSWGTGVTRSSTGPFQPPAEKVPSAFRARVHSICQRDDLVCDFPNGTGHMSRSLAIHGNSYSSTGSGKFAQDGLVFVKSAATNVAKVTRGWWRPPAEPVPTPDPIADPETETLRLVNLARSAGRWCGQQFFPPIEALTESPLLRSASEKYAYRMASEGFFGHQAPDGSSPGDRALAEGYTLEVAENIAAGPTSPAQVVNGWLGSPGHCQNIMTVGSGAGVGHAFESGSSYGHYWVLMGTCTCQSTTPVSGEGTSQ